MAEICRYQSQEIFFLKSTHFLYKLQISVLQISKLQISVLQISFARGRGWKLLQMDFVASKKNPLEILDVEPFEEPYHLGLQIGKKFSNLIQSRVAQDLILQQQLIPFAQTSLGKSLTKALCTANSQQFPRYWDEMRGTADGSCVPVLHIMLLNLRKEILPFIPNEDSAPKDTADDDCSDVLVVNDSMAIAAHNEDANLALVGHTYLVRARLLNGLSFTAYTYAGELPSCAFGFNSHGMAFTLNSVPPSRTEITAGGIGRNFISRDLLEATGIEDALDRIQSCNPSVGHSYNLVDAKHRKILNVETASNNRVSVHQVGETPFFHANMYVHLKVDQVQDENSISRHKRAAQLSARSITEILSVLGDSADKLYPIYMTGPLLYTMCTALIDLDQQTMTILESNPKSGSVLHVLPII